MDIPTSILEVSGVLMVRIPIQMVRELGLTKNMRASVVDVNPRLIELRFSERKNIEKQEG